MFTSTVVAALRWSILMGLLALFVLSVFSRFPVAYSKFPFLNRKCNVYFNFTHQFEETKHTWTNQYKQYETCWNNTVENFIGLNLTSKEKGDCSIKCAHLVLGIVNQDGTFSLKYMDRIKEEYKKYSNATEFFIEKIASMLSGCEKEAAETYKTLKETEETDFRKCKMNARYESCWQNVYWAQVYNATVQQACGDQQK